MPALFVGAIYHGSSTNSAHLPHRDRDLDCSSFSQSRQFHAITILAQTLLSEVPQNRRRALYGCRQSALPRRIADALTTLVRFEALHPEYGRLFQERGSLLPASEKPPPQSKPINGRPLNGALRQLAGIADCISRQQDGDAKHSNQATRIAHLRPSA